MTATVSGSDAPVAAPRPRRSTDPHARRHQLVIGLAAALLVSGVVAVVAFGVPFADEDSALDLLASLGSVVRPLGALRWQFLPALAALTVAHYVLAAIALRAAAGHPLALRETTMAQFAAAAANRLTPAGIGAIGVNARYLTRRGTPFPVATLALTVLAVLGAAADVALFGAIMLTGRLLGVAPLAHSALWPQLPSLPADPAFLAVSGLALAGVGGVALFPPVRARIARRTRSGAAAIRQVAGEVRRLGQRPRDLVVLVAASGGTTLVLALSLVVSVHAAGAGSSTIALLLAYLTGAAAGSAVPVPAGIGSTETLLVAAIVAVHVPLAHAVPAVLLFRAVTFWAPVPVGLVLARPLRRRGAL